MDLDVLVRILLRRWYVVVGVAIALTWAGVSIVSGLDNRYVASGSVGLFSPDDRPPEERDGPDNPFLATGDPLLQPAQAIAALATNRSTRAFVGDLGYVRSYTVTPAAGLPILRIETEAADPESAVETTAFVIDLVMDTIRETQRIGGSDVEHDLRSMVLTIPEQATVLASQGSRVITALVALGLVLVLGATLLLESGQGSGSDSRTPPGAAAAAARRRSNAEPGLQQPMSVLGLFLGVAVLVPQHNRFGGFSVTLATVLGLTAAWVWIYGRSIPGSGFARRRSPVTTGVALIGAVIAVSYAINQTRVLEEFETKGADRKTLALLAMFGVALLAADGIRRVDSVRRLVAAAVLLLSVNAAMGLAQFGFGFDLFGLTRIARRGGVPRSAGFANHPIDFGVACAVGVPLAMHLAAHATTQRGRRLATVAAMTCAGGAMTSVSRSAALCLLIGVVILLAGRRGPHRTRPIAWAVVLAAVLVVAIPQTLDGYELLLSGQTGTASINSRTADYAPVYEAFSQRPVLGSGFGTFEPTERFVLDNSYLKVMVELGALGIAAMMILLGAAVTSGRAVRAESSDTDTRDLAQALVAAVVALAVSGLFYDLIGFQQGSALLFLLLGLIAAMRRISTDEADGRVDTAPDPVRPRIRLRRRIVGVNPLNSP